MLDFPSHREANARYREIGEPGVSIQLWSIVEKIRELDVLKTSGLAIDLHETHPELVFRRLNKERILCSKKSSEGRNRRVSLLEEMGFTRVREWLGERYRTGIGRDDLVDACVCAIAARDAICSLPKVGEPPDAKGLEMRIWY